ncbi:MAG: hypothetical protein SGI74_05240 [Oligoflexia bacterium]|nr:hypothetical protein [Oligoflexia bacterium]
MTIRDQGIEGNAKVVLTDIQVEVEDPTKLGLPSLMAKLSKVMFLGSGMNRFTLSGRIKQKFYTEGDVGVMSEDWVQPLTMKMKLLWGIEMPVPLVADVIQELTNKVMPVMDIRGIKNFATALILK